MTNSMVDIWHDYALKSALNSTNSDQLDGRRLLLTAGRALNCIKNW